MVSSLVIGYVALARLYMPDGKIFLSSWFYMFALYDCTLPAFFWPAILDFTIFQINWKIT